MFEVTWLTWTVTIAVIVAILVFDLAVGVLRPHKVGFMEAALWSIAYIAVAIGFGAWLSLAHGAAPGTEYFTGYILEKSLSIDNVFVFVIIMTTFAVPDAYQQEVLTFGIALALVMRAAFIALGATLMALFSFMFALFGVLLIYTAVQLFRHRDEDPDIENSMVVKLTRRFLPVTPHYIGGKLVARVENRWRFTPLFVVLVTIGGVDLLFALDSIPAVFGVTREPYIVFAVNAFALLGLRPLFFLVKDLLSRLVYLSTGLSLILAFIGVKLILHWAHMDISTNVPEISTPLSLGVVVAVLVVVTAASWVKTHRDPTARAHAGALRGAPPAGSTPQAPTEP